METNFNLKTDSLIIKIILIAVLSLLMLIPMTMIQNLITERSQSQNTVQDEITSKWGGEQTVTGPVLVVPYIKDKKILQAYFLPDNLTIDGSVLPEERSRTIYQTLVYQSDMKISGNFSFPDIDKLNTNADEVKWGDAFILLGVSSLQGIKNKINFELNGKIMTVSPGVPSNTIIGSGITIKTPLEADNRAGKYNFNFDLALNGSKGLYFTPVGKETHVHITSPWKTVSLWGDYIASKRTINENGFDTQWDIFDYNRNYSQMWIGANNELNETSFGVSLQYPVDQYQMLNRSAKYAIMFIAFTFIAFLMIELLRKKPIHPVQYLLVSAALVLFYSLLLALSEHLGFRLAYGISSAAVILLITLYTTSIFIQKKQSAIVCGILITLYTYLYVILQLEDMALLFGSIGLFIVLAVIMYVSRKVDWYKIDSRTDEQKQEIPPIYNPNNEQTMN